jgi:Protein of unknown function (DUF4435)
MLSYPARSAPALGFLRRSANDVDIYVEDAARSDIWLAILRLCLPNRIRLSNVNPLGDRTSVIAACRSDQSDTRPRLYIVDGDFDFTLGRGLPRIKNLYRIPATNLEAFVLMTGGFEPLIAQMLPSQSIENISEDIKINLHDVWFNLLIRLFIFYAENERTNAGQMTSGYNVQRFRIVNSLPWQPDLGIIARRAKEISVHCRLAAGTGKTKFLEIKSRTLLLPIEKIVSGKTYLWPLFEHYFRQKVKFSIKAEQLMLLVIAHGECPSESLRRRLRQQCQSILK